MKINIFLQFFTVFNKNFFNFFTKIYEFKYILFLIQKMKQNFKILQFFTEFTAKIGDLCFYTFLHVFMKFYVKKHFFM